MFSPTDNFGLKKFDVTLDGKWLKSVSYTHLRAHETVLDLVCRLLLEKKNTHLVFYNFYYVKYYDTDTKYITIYIYA